MFYINWSHPPKNKPNHYFYFRCYGNKIIIILILFYGLIPAAVQRLLRTRANCKWNGLHSPPIICEVLKGHFHLTFELCVSANEVGVNISRDTMRRKLFSLMRSRKTFISSSHPHTQCVNLRCLNQLTLQLQRQKSLNTNNKRLVST